MNDLSTANDSIAIVHGQLQIIFKSELYSFAGKYSLTDDDTTMLSKNGLQFDYLITIEDHNLAVHTRDHTKIQNLLNPDSLQRYVKFEIRLVTSAGLIRILTAEGKIFHVFKKTAAEWKSTQDELSRAHDLLQTVFDASPHGISVYRILYNRKGEPEDFEILSLNAPTALTIGMRPDEVIGKTFGKLFPDFRKTGVYDHYINVAATGTRADFEITYPVHGDVRWFRFIVVRTGNLLVSTIEDVTRHRQDEARVNQTENLLQHVIDAPNIGLTIFKAIRDESGAITDFEHEFANRRTCETLGFNPTGKRLTTYGSDGTSQLDAFKEVVETGKTSTYTRKIESGIMEGWYLLFSNARLSEDRLVHIWEDISELKKAERELNSVKEQLARQAEDKYRALFNAIDEGFCILEMIFDDQGKALDYRFAETNPAFEKLTDLKDVVGKTIRSLRPEHEEIWFEIYGQVATSGQPTRFIQSTQSLKGRWYELYAFPIGPTDKNKVAVLFTDITERRLTEVQLKELNKQLRELDKAKTEFFSNVSHEFRTPITLVLAPLNDLLREERLHPWSAIELQRLQLMHRSAIRLQKLVNTLLDFSRAESQRMEAIFQPTDLEHFTAAIASNFRSTIENAGLRFIVKAAALAGPVYVNHDMWEKIVLNLISNAFKFTHHGKIEVVLKAKKKYVELRVRDTGIGIAPGNLNRIFQRFTRIEGVKARTYEGSGIGLSLVREFVRMHKGTIKVNSIEGEGSEFIVTIPKGKKHLPQRQVFESESHTESNVAEAFLDESKSWHNPLRTSEMPAAGSRDTVLVVDDNADMREYLTSVLNAHYHVVTAENGRQALGHITGGLKPVLVLTDLMMPEMEGHALVQAIRNNPATESIPVVVLSARSGEAARIESLQTGADDYLTKPFSAQELITLIWARLQVTRQRQETETLLSRKNSELEQLVEQRTTELLRSRHDLVLVNNAISKKNHELKIINDELANFVFIASHDLREPLRKILFFSNQLIDREASRISSKGRELTGKIQASVQRLNALIEDILAYSQTASTPRTSRTRVNLNNLVQQVLGSLTKSIEEKNVSIAVDPLTELWADPIQLSQLLLNLISNAIKFQPKDRTPVVNISGFSLLGKQIGSDLANDNTRYFRLEVMDNGIGFDPKYADRIFHMFQRLHSKNEYPGTGMGLAICKKIVENHNGFMVAKGMPGIGAVFYCYFPV